MLSIARSLTTIAAVSVLVAACGDSPVAPAPLATAATVNADANAVDRTLLTGTWDMTDTFVSWSCGDESENELVALEGQVHYKETRSQLPNGGFQVRFETMGVGLRGVGVESGAEYRYADDEKIVFNATPMAQTSNWSLTIRLVNSETQKGIAITYYGRSFIDANGNLAVERQGERVRCDE